MEYFAMTATFLLCTRYSYVLFVRLAALACCSEFSSVKAWVLSILHGAFLVYGFYFPYMSGSIPLQHALVFALLCAGMLGRMHGKLVCISALLVALTTALLCHALLIALEENTVFALYGLVALSLVHVFEKTMPRWAVDSLLAMGKNHRVASLVLVLVLLPAIAPAGYTEATAMLHGRVVILIALSIFVFVGYSWYNAHMALRMRTVTQLSDAREDILGTCKDPKRIDALTGLQDRDFVFEQLRSCLVGETDFYLLCVDIDGLRHINDRHGYAEGDICIQLVAKALRQSFTNQLVARLDGATFLVMGTMQSMTQLRLQTVSMYHSCQRMGTMYTRPYTIGVHYGIVAVEREAKLEVEQLLALAVARMRGGH